MLYGIFPTGDYTFCVGQLGQYLHQEEQGGQLEEQFGL